MIFEEISAEEAIERGTRPSELIYMLHRVCEDTTVSELSSSAGFVRIVPDDIPEPGDKPKKADDVFCRDAGRRILTG